MHVRLISLALLVVTGGAWAPDVTLSRPGSSPRHGVTLDKDKTRIEAATRLFEFHSSFWLNLHHFLYQQALVRSGNTRAARTGGEAVFKEPQLPEADLAWSAAVDYYGASLINRDLLFDQGMVDTNARLSQVGEVSNPSVSGLDPTLLSKLRGAAPVYRSHWWSQHDLTNRAWVASVSPLLKQMGDEISARLMSLYGAKWPEASVRVEMVSYANWAGAYTSDHPLLITLASDDKPDRKYEGLETLFHEASHAFDPLQEEKIANECRAQKRRPPRNLWHAMIFYTTGEVVKKALAEHHLGSYIPYAYHYGIYDRGWKDYLKALEADWQPYLDGKTDFDHALSSLVADVALEASKQH